MNRSPFHRATILHLLGIDHTKLTFRHNGIDRRLTDVHVEMPVAALREGAVVRHHDERLFLGAHRIHIR